MRFLQNIDKIESEILIDNFISNTNTNTSKTITDINVNLTFDKLNNTFNTFSDIIEKTSSDIFYNLSENKKYINLIEIDIILHICFFIFIGITLLYFYNNGDLQNI